MNRGSNSGVIGFGSNNSGYNSDSDSDSEPRYLGAYITQKTPSEQIDYAKNSILSLALGLDFSVTSKLSSEKKNSLIKDYMTRRNIQFDPNDLTKLNQLRDTLLEESRLLQRSAAGKQQRKSKKYRKSKKQRKTKRKTRRLRRSYKYKYK